MTYLGLLAGLIALFTNSAFGAQHTIGAILVIVSVAFLLLQVAILGFVGRQQKKFLDRF